MKKTDNACPRVAPVWATRADAPKPSRRRQKSGRPPLRRRWTTPQREVAWLTAAAGTLLWRLAALGHGGEQPCRRRVGALAGAPTRRAGTRRPASSPVGAPAPSGCHLRPGSVRRESLSLRSNRAGGLLLPRPRGATALDGCSWRRGARQGSGPQLASSVALVGPGPADEFQGTADCCLGAAGPAPPRSGGSWRLRFVWAWPGRGGGCSVAGWRLALSAWPRLMAVLGGVTTDRGESIARRGELGEEQM